ncbi:phosphoribosyl-ATP diphosphatase [Jiella sp. MQZ9-1]|uniref:Phosphoribosyl-ATP pyrophosphatase n=1 Tax=Jiella flava TaxID=2816857 RepID=A0A939G099_9HYPH|nr:phosphoribosyl-ATP diphosphatase [Jiella flava]MBO0663475.1 phosphoribosyl-ATP diphosphatase [Jiella flava]MCD2472050.1 phosphoribosyl-ATP diphosphatase [Jiella flava]
MSDFTLEDLETIVAARSRSGDAASYTATLMRKGIGHTAKKLGEEAVETIIAATSEDAARLTSESADLLYHLLVLLHLKQVPLSAVMAELARRTAQTGLEEKAGRPKQAGD